MTLAVITVVSGRHDHLRAQRRHLAHSRHPAELHVVVALADPEVDGVVDDGLRPTATVLNPEVGDGPLPVAAARNLGAAEAVGRGADVLVFLDVDCLPAPDCLRRLCRVLHEQPDALVSGVVTYLPPAPPQGWDELALLRSRSPHPARPAPPDGTSVDLAPELFWSLCFAVTTPTWTRVRGFYEGFVGYGAEDTDLAFRAAEDGLPLLMAGGADAFHQHHPVHDPPVEHLDDILRNSAIFRGRHGRTPMQGWLREFNRRGLVDGDTLRRIDAVRLASIPPRHPYVDAVRPPTVLEFEPDRVHDWQPDPLFDAGTLAANADGIDVVHLHFGYDHLNPRSLDDWLAGLDAAGIPLVVTVHDIRNPHHRNRDRHDAHLRSLMSAATRVLTLTGSAAEELERRYGRRADVVPHPTVDDGPVPRPATASRRALVPLKALRTNVVEPMAVVDAVRRATERTGARTSVLVEPAAFEDARLEGLRDADVDLDIAPYLDHDDLRRRVADAHVCVLPYRYGTHSGWIELCRDVGTRVVAPDCGHYLSQWDQVIGYRNNERDGLDADSLTDAVLAAVRFDRPPPADPHARQAERDVVMARHDVLYRQVAGR